ncbi:hypothetical protein PHJA_001848900 [Phtheirospermum japonicum]|uniref:Uncharacterized protein n=1 Tax=Phtheirospermum japonicum TaxID=374723 RepID=A0A830CIM1_9LAMI|nr:hypothetical protein PHJA_001848900 [Phtheirospermum japonicum]
MFWCKPSSLALASDSAYRVDDPQYEGIKRVILKLILFYNKQSQFLHWANGIYSRVTYQVDRPAIYDVFSLETTFKTTFSLLVLHMWRCLRRLKEEGKGRNVFLDEGTSKDSQPSEGALPFVQASYHRIIVGGGVPARVLGNMVLLAPPGDCCRRIRVLPEPEKVTFMDLITDLLALLDALNLSKVFLIGKDFGVSVVSIFTLLHQDKVLGFVTIGIPFSLPRPATYIESLPEGYYISRWQPGRAEADFGRLDAKTVVKNVYILFSKSEIPIAQENQEIMNFVEPNTPLPYWFTKEDLSTYGSLKKTFPQIAADEKELILSSMPADSREKGYALYASLIDEEVTIYRRKKKE